MSPAIFIVGAGPGIGGTVGKHFASKGFSLGLIARSQATLDASSSGSASSSGGVIVSTRTADVTDYQGMVQALDSLKAELGGPSIVLYNVASGTLGSKPLNQLTAQDLEEHLKISAVGALNVAQWAAKNLETRETAEKKAIFFTGGGLYEYPRFPDWEGLACGKAALRNLALGLHDHYKKSGIHVAIVNIAGWVKDEDPKYNAVKIAEEWWKIYEEKENWTQDVLY